MESYTSYRELRKNETPEEDYHIRMRCGMSGIAVMAPHGGWIEPGTTEIASAVAGNDHTFYSFSGIKARGNAGLHMTSSRFDEPVGSDIAKRSKIVLTIHGCREKREFVSLGGRNAGLIKDLGAALREADFEVFQAKRHPGQHPDNICNRNGLGNGVQLEISSGLREALCPVCLNEPQKRKTTRFKQFVLALRRVLAKYAGKVDDQRNNRKK